MSAAATTHPISPPRRWKKPPFIANTKVRLAIYVGAGFYLVVGLGSLRINWTRVIDGMERGLQFILAFFAPDFVTRWVDISEGFLESLSMTAVATAIGFLISVPIGFGGARNISPLPIYLICRSIITMSRAFQEVIVAILFVAMFGFGPFAGVMTLSFASIGFLAKLLAEDIEDIDPDQLESIRATGASWLQLMNYAVQPQVSPRLVGLTMYRLDINFRESAIIGIVGAGGIGATLNTAFDRYEFDSAAAILLIIIAIVMASEYASSYIRGKLI